MTRKVEFPDLVNIMSDLNREHKPKIVVYDEHTLGIWYPERPDEHVVEDLALSIRKVGIH